MIDDSDEINLTTYHTYFLALIGMGESHIIKARLNLHFEQRKIPDWLALTNHHIDTALPSIETTYSRLTHYFETRGGDVLYNLLALSYKKRQYLQTEEDVYE